MAGCGVRAPHPDGLTLATLTSSLKCERHQPSGLALGVSAQVRLSHSGRGFGCGDHKRADAVQPGCFRGVDVVDGSSDDKIGALVGHFFFFCFYDGGRVAFGQSSVASSKVLAAVEFGWQASLPGVCVRSVLRGLAEVRALGRLRRPHWLLVGGRGTAASHRFVLVFRSLGLHCPGWQVSCCTLGLLAPRSFVHSGYCRSLGVFGGLSVRGLVQERLVAWAFRSFGTHAAVSMFVLCTSDWRDALELLLVLSLRGGVLRPVTRRSLRRIPLVAEPRGSVASPTWQRGWKREWVRVSAKWARGCLSGGESWPLLLPD